MSYNQNMKKYFYSHIVDIESIIGELDGLDLSENERTHLITLFDSSIHHAVLDAILSELSGEDKKLFLRHLSLLFQEEKSTQQMASS